MWKFVLEIPNEFDAVAVFETKVNNGDVGFEGHRLGEPLTGSARFAAALEVSLLAEEPDEAAADHGVIVDEKDSVLAWGGGC